MIWSTNRTEAWAIVVCLASGALLCIALFMELVLGLTPCPMCMMQRIWLALCGIIASISLAHNPRLGIYPLLAGICAAVGASFSFRQLQLQSLPADQVPSCGPSLDYMIQAFPLSEVLTAMTQGTGDCAAVSWSLLGLSIPGWLFLFFLALIGGCIMQFRQGLR